MSRLRMGPVAWIVAMGVAVLVGVGAMAAEARAAAAGKGAAAAKGTTSGNATSAGSAAGHGPVLIELFTSQGCSSCPPADRLLSRLKRDPRLAGAVVPLAFHVDYWNHLGWTDPFSSADWSRRQESYAHAFHSNRIYTPQLVVNGRTECVGSQEDLVLRRIKDALAAEPAAQVILSEPELPISPVPAAGGTLRVTVSARLLRSAGSAGTGLDLWVALTESGLTTAVGAGENSSATLHDDQVVRRLVRAFTLPPSAGAEHAAKIVLPFEPPRTGVTYDVVAFLQDPQSLAIAGAASRPVVLR